MPLFLITEEGTLQIFTTEGKNKAHAGQTLISLVAPQAETVDHAGSPAPEKAPADIKA